MNQLQLFLPCAAGVEELLAAEVHAITQPPEGAIRTMRGGVMLDGAYADVLAEHIPELRYTASSAEQISLFGNPKDKYTQWTHWGFLAVFVGLITAEWIIRKANGLV